MEAARRERDIAAKELTDAIRQAEKYIAAPNPNGRLLRQRISRIEERELRLRECHYTYLDKAKISINDETESKYLVDLADKALDCSDKCQDLIPEDTPAAPPAPPATVDAATIAATHANTATTSSEPDKKTRCKLIKREIAMDEKFADQLVVKLNEILDSPDVDSQEDIIGSVKSHDDKLSETLANLDKSWKSLMSVIDTDDEEEESTRINNTRMKFQGTHTKAIKLIEKQKSTSEVARLAEQVETSSVTADSVQSNNSTRAHSMVRPEKMKLPNFSGDIRHYASFKKDFKQIVQPFYVEDMHQVFVMKQSCLSGDPKSLVANLEDMNLIWKRLDDKYGDKLDLVEVVIKELETLPSVKINEDAKFVLIVDTLEKGLLDLEAIGARDEIANAYTVKMLENKMSRQMYLIWLEKMEETEEKANETEEKSSEASEEVSEGTSKLSRFATPTTRW